MRSLGARRSHISLTAHSRTDLDELRDLLLAGAPEIHNATLYNVRTFFGWVTTAEAVATAIR